MQKLSLVLVLGLSVFASNGFAEEREKTIDKSGYNLFHRVPKPMLRELSPDRPDKTETAYTVDPGWFQFEADLLAYSRNRETDLNGDEVTKTSLSTNIYIKAGLTHNLDFQVLFSPRVNEKEKTVLDETKKTGIGDTTLRVKWNLFGNDSGKVALALLPFYTVPTAKKEIGSGSAQWGLALPISMEIPAEFRLGTMIAFRRERETADSAYATKFISTLTLGHALFPHIDLYAEIYSETAASGEDAPWVSTFDTGAEWDVGHNIMVDVGANFALSDAAEDFNPFLGLTYRF